MTIQSIQEWATDNVVVAVGWGLVHSVWQIGLIAAASWLVLRMMSRRSAQARYFAACAGLSLMAAAPLVTSSWYGTQERTAVGKSAGIGLADPESETISLANARLSEGGITRVAPTPSREHGSSSHTDEHSESNPISAEAQEPAPANSPRESRAWRDAFESWLPFAVGIWALGVATLAMQLLGGLSKVRRLRNQGSKPPHETLEAAFDRLRAIMACRAVVRIRETSRTRVPTVVGWLRPVILVPIGLATGLPPHELDALLAHELAHVRRHDYLVNLTQTVIETLLFYHPAVWWLSRSIRGLREDCCDDEAVRACGNRLALARALASVEESRFSGHSLALAASGGALKRRIRRLLVREPETTGSWWLAGLVSLGLVIAVAVAARVSLAQNEPSSEATEVQQVAESKKAEKERAAIESSPRAGVKREKVEAIDPRAEKRSLKYATHKPESTKRDGRTGAEKKLLADVEVAAIADGFKTSTRVDLVYSSVFRYTVIPARVAHAIGAEKLGTIEFGATSPRANAENTPLLDLKSFQAAAGEGDTKPSLEPADAKPEPIYVGQDVGKRREIEFTPFPMDEFWVPGHLSFYNMNGQAQHKFEVVRIDFVDLGIGPTFGPIHALVSDDANSEFGVMGADWATAPPGPEGKGLIHSAGNGFYFGHVNYDGTIDTSIGDSVMSEQGKVIATREYSSDSRTSTAWIELNGVGVPVDEGVEYDGVKVYVSLMHDVLAVDVASKKVLWSVPWTKAMPMYEAVAIVAIERDGKSGFIVRLTPIGKKDDPTSVQEFDLHTGRKLGPGGEDSKVTIPLRKETDASGETTGASLTSPGNSLSATEWAKRFADTFRQGSAAGFVTREESVVKVKRPENLQLETAEAEEVEFLLPKGSGLRADFRGEKLTLGQSPDGMGETVTITKGSLELLDSGGVTRAGATPGERADELLVECREENGGYRLKVQARNANPYLGLTHRRVAFGVNPRTGAADDETEPPHGAIRYEVAAPKPDGDRSFAFKMKWHFDLRRLAAEAERESGRKLSDILGDQPPSQIFIDTRQTDSGPESTLFSRANALGNWFNNSRVRFDANAYRELAADLLKLNETDRASELRAIAAEGLEGQVFALCRMLFEGRPGQEFRAPLIGAARHVGAESDTPDFPLEPIHLLEGGTPLLIVRGYSLGGQAETATAYLEYCLANLAWTRREFKAPEEPISDTLRNLQRLAFWHGSLNIYELQDWAWLGRQLTPEFVGLSVSSGTTPDAAPTQYWLDTGENVTPKDVVEKAGAICPGSKPWISIFVDDGLPYRAVAEIATPLIESGAKVDIVDWRHADRGVRVNKPEDLTKDLLKEEPW